MELKELASKCLEFHSKPLTKVELPTTKCFLDSPDEQKLKIAKYQDILGESLKYVRVDRRCSRSKGIWNEEFALCKVTKVVGPLLKNFGFQDKSGIYFLPEETLFLIEQNRLELKYGNKEVSICEAFDLLTKQCTLKKYRVYKKLVGQGFKLVNNKTIRRFYLSAKNLIKNKDPTQLKRKNVDLNSQDGYVGKIRKKSDINEMPASSDNQDNGTNCTGDIFIKIFDELRAKSPKLIHPNASSHSPDYFGFLPSSTNKHRHEFNLYIRDTIDDFENFEDVPNIIAICTNDNIAFYRFSNVNIPTLI